MFPSQNDIESFKSEFGPESVLHRLAIPRQSYHGTQAAAVTTPVHTKDETLSLAWELVRSIAHWILARSSKLPPTERYEIIVGWSQSVRELQGQIFKVVGDHATICLIAESTDWRQHEQALRSHWEKDLF